MSTTPPPTKAARTEHSSKTSVGPLSGGHFVGRKSGASLRAYSALSATRPLAPPPLSGCGKSLCWIYAHGSKGIEVWSIDGERRTLHGAVPLFRTDIHEGVTSFIAECGLAGSGASLVFCSSLGCVASLDRSINFRFEVDAPDHGLSNYFDVRSFTYLSPQDDIRCALFRERIPLAEHAVAGTEDGLLLCAVRDRENPKRFQILYCEVAEDDANCTAAVAEGIDQSGIHLNGGGGAGPASWWRAWIPSIGARPNTATSPSRARADGLSDDGYTFKGAASVLRVLPSQRIEFVQHAKGGLLFSVGGEAIGFATKVSEPSAEVDTAVAGPSHGIRLVWASALSSATHVRSRIVALTSSEDRVYALAVYLDESSMGLLLCLSVHNGRVVQQKDVTLTADALDAVGAASPSHVQILLADDADPTSRRVALVMGNSVTRVNLHVTARNPCSGEEVTMMQEVLASGVGGDGAVHVLTDEGPIALSDVGEMNDARARRVLDGVRATLRQSGSTISAEAAVLAAAEEIARGTVHHSANWARMDDKSGCEDASMLAHIATQLARRQQRHRAFVSGVFLCADLAPSIGLAARADLISQQEMLLVLRSLRAMQTMESTTGVQQLTQALLRRCVVTVGRALTKDDAAKDGTTPAEVFFSSEAHVSLLLKAMLDECTAILESNALLVQKVDAAIACGHIFVRVVETIGESRSALMMPPSSVHLLWTHTEDSQRGGLLPFSQAVTGLLSQAAALVAYAQDGREREMYQQPSHVLEAAQASLVEILKTCVTAVCTVLTENATVDPAANTASDPKVIISQTASISKFILETLLREPFLVPKKVDENTGEATLFGFPHGSPTANPRSPLAAAILSLAERTAVAFAVTDVLFVFSMSSPTAFDAVMAADTPAEKARAEYGRFQSYCAEHDTFLRASMHLLLADVRFQREGELADIALLCGWEDKEEVQRLRNDFLTAHAPHLLWVIDPDACAASSEGLATLLSEGALNADTLVYGEDRLAHAEHSYAMAELIRFACVPEANPAFDAMATEVEGARIVAAYQRRFLPRSCNSILATPVLVQQLLTLPDDVDAWAAAAVLCDTLRGDQQVVTSLLVRTLQVAATYDGPTRLSELRTSCADEDQLAGAIAGTAQGRVLMASHKLSGLRGDGVAQGLTAQSPQRLTDCLAAAAVNEECAKILRQWAVRLRRLNANIVRPAGAVYQSDDLLGT